MVLITLNITERLIFLSLFIFVFLFHFQVSLLLGTIIRKIPLPSNIPSDKSKAGDHFADASDVPSMTTSDVPSMTTSDVMLDLKQLETIGKHFLEVLLKMKHNGAIDKTRAGFTALCNRLLCSNDPRYVSFHSLCDLLHLVLYLISCFR